MNEYIKKEDVENILQTILNKHKNDKQYCYTDNEYSSWCGGDNMITEVQEVVSNIPIADVQQVVYGENLTKQHPSDEFICSNCGFTAEDFCGYNIEDDVYYEFQIKFCPCCGRIIKE